jgi:hypothetical protein
MEDVMDILDMGPDAVTTVEGVAWTQGMLDALGWGLLFALLFLLPVIALFREAVKRRRLWCSRQSREVEVLLDERGWPGFRHPVAVRTCSAFDPSTDVTCRRHCLHPDYHRKWPLTLPGLGDVDSAEVSDRR